MLQSSSSEKKMAKTSKKIAVFGAQFGVIMCYAQNKKQFSLSKITKADHHFSETFFFIKVSRRFGWVMNLFLFCDVLCQKKVISS